MGADAHVAQGSFAIASHRWANPPLSDCWLAAPRQTSTRRAFRITAASIAPDAHADAGNAPPPAAVAHLTAGPE